MTFASAVLRALNEYTAAFQTTAYAMFAIETHVICVIVLAVVLNHQQNVSDLGRTRVYWSRLLLFQILHCVTGILRILADIKIISDSYALPYVTAALNFASSGCVCLMAFMYTESSQNSELIKPLRNKIILSVPLILNVIILIAAPFFGGRVDFSTGFIKIGSIFPFMQAMNLGYLFSAAALAFIRRSRVTRYERDMTPNAVIYPAVLFIFLIMQTISWKIPIFCGAVLVTNIFVYMRYTDSLVSIDPLTKIPNKNGMTKNLSEKLRELNNSDEKEFSKTLYLFAVDVDILSSNNSDYNRFESDKNLIIIAAALKKFSEEAHQCYISRYYGSEFFIIAEIQDKDELELFTEHIRNYINNAATANGLHYHFRVNIGLAKYEKYSRLETISGLIEEADKMLNENKEQRKFQNLWQAAH